MWRDILCVVEERVATTNKVPGAAGVCSCRRARLRPHFVRGKVHALTTRAGLALRERKGHGEDVERFDNSGAMRNPHDNPSSAIRETVRRWMP
jgi:hypothetical protein